MVWSRKWTTSSPQCSGRVCGCTLPYPGRWGHDQHLVLPVPIKLSVAVEQSPGVRSISLVTTQTTPVLDWRCFSEEYSSCNRSSRLLHEADRSCHRFLRTNYLHHLQKINISWSVFVRIYSGSFGRKRKDKSNLLLTCTFCLKCISIDIKKTHPKPFFHLTVV